MCTNIGCARIRPGTAGHAARADNQALMWCRPRGRLSYCFSSDTNNCCQMFAKMRWLGAGPPSDRPSKRYLTMNSSFRIKGKICIAPSCTSMHPCVRLWRAKRLEHVNMCSAIAQQIVGPFKGICNCYYEHAVWVEQLDPDSVGPAIGGRVGLYVSM